MFYSTSPSVLYCTVLLHFVLMITQKALDRVCVDTFGYKCTS